jgi:hypothetical protein
MLMPIAVIVAHSVERYIPGNEDTIAMPCELDVDRGEIRVVREVQMDTQLKHCIL